ncbi:MAG: response regulator transcription factor [Bacteroidetes bacterium]|nr:response regulator transcription factor [Bacteroidota bacterium]
MKGKLAKILLVEDDPNLSEVLKDYLEMLDYEIVRCFDGEQGLSVFYRQGFDLVLVDVMMPKKDGFTLVEEIRKINKEIPVIFITAKSFKEDRIQGFKVGCDDYICKPFSTEELSLRVHAVLKRCQVNNLNLKQLSEKGAYELGGFRFDYSNMSLSFGDKTQHLTRKEADLLRLLVINKNQLLKRETALKLVWGDDDYFIGRSMDVFITKLRKYLKDDDSINILNVHGTGFKLEVQEGN